MNVLVTGGAGYIGSHCLPCLKAAGHRPFVLDNLSEGHRAAVGDCKLYVADFGDRAAVKQALTESKIDAVIHYAAHCYVGESVDDPAKYYRNNIVNAISLLDTMREVGVNRFVFSSTCATYGVPQSLPLTEDQPQNPINPYGRSKLMVEMVLKDFAHAYGLRFAALRYFNVAGADPTGKIGEDHDPETHLIPIILQVALGRQPDISIFGTDYPTPDGTCIRDYIHVTDLAAAHILALEALDGKPRLIYNLGNGNGFSVREVIETARKVTGREIPTVETAARPGDPPQLVGSSAKIKKELGWQPQYAALETIIDTAWQWHKSRPDGFGDRG